MVDTKELEEKIQKFAVLGNWPEDEDFVEAEEVQMIAKELIPKYHSDIEKAKIAYIFKEKGSTSGDKIELGTMKRAGKSFRFFTDYDYIMTIGWTQWTELSPTQKIALVDHELCHAHYNYDKERFEIKGHSVEEFREIIDRHGFWKDDVKLFADTCKKVV